MSKDNHKAWGGNWYRGYASQLENRAADLRQQAEALGQ